MKGDVESGLIALKVEPPLTALADGFKATVTAPTVEPGTVAVAPLKSTKTSEPGV